MLSMKRFFLYNIVTIKYNTPYATFCEGKSFTNKYERKIFHQGSTEGDYKCVKKKERVPKIWH